MGRYWFGTKAVIGIAACAVAAMAAVFPRSASADAIPPGWVASRMEPVGFTGLEGRPGAFKLAIKQVQGRWYLYTGHSFDHGWSIIDVTDPRDPKYVKFVSQPTAWITGQVTLHDNLLITALNSFIDRPDGTPAILIWDISDPLNPKQVSQWQGGVRGSHRNSYPGGKYAYLATSAPGYTGYIFVALDVSDPANPKEAGRWWTPGQKKGEPPATVSPSLHGPIVISPDGKMATMSYTPSIVNLDISDIAQPKLIGSLQMTPPFIEVGVQSVHTVLPLWDRKLLFASSEPMAEGCDKDALNFAVLIDNKNPAKPRLMSMFPVPRPPAGSPYRNFCEKGGRFGPHNVNTEIHSPDVEQPGNLIYMTYFNAGLRVFDISDPHLPTETGWFIPPERPDAPIHKGQHASKVNWTEDVLVDTRGYVYISDDKWGVWVLRYTGEGQPAPTAK